MKLRKLITPLLFLAAAGCAWAQGDFRNHRYDSFKATPTEGIEVMFVGNSITHMHEWWEAFGATSKVGARGNSGALATEILPNLESYIDGAPKKLFLMIGTNDIRTNGTEETGRMTAKRIRAIVRRVQLESPETEIFVQSILPRAGMNASIPLCNQLVKGYCEELGVNYIDLTGVCAGIADQNDWSIDKLHPQPKGYAAWTRHIQDLVGYNSVYPAPETITEYKACGTGGSHAMRLAQFPFYEVKEGDVLIFGDEMVHGAEWNDLLSSDKIKERGTGWGTGGINLTQARQVVAAAIENQAHKPAKIFINYGEGGKDPANYRLILDEAKKQAPDAKIYAVSLTPRTNANDDKAVTDFNDVIKAAAEEKGATYVDIFTPLAANRAANIAGSNFISGRGYVVIANELAKYLTEEGVNPVSAEQAETLIARRNARSIVGNALTDALMLEYGSNPGQIKEDNRPAVEAAIAEAAAAISNEMTTAQANAAVSKLTEAIARATSDANYPTASTPGNDHWYVLKSVRGARVATAADDNTLVGTTAIPTTSSYGDNVWKLELRDDNTYNIVNPKGIYVNSAGSANNTVLKLTDVAPEAGWQIGLSQHTPGTFVIYSPGTNAQFNQAGGPNYVVLNWHNATFPTLTDEGCSYYFTEFTGDIIEPMAAGWHRVKVVSGINNLGDATSMVNADVEKFQSTTGFSYALQYAAPSADKPAKEFIYITPNGSTWQFTGLNGHGIQENCTSARESLAASNPAVTLVDGNNYHIGHWNIWEENYVGKSSSTNNTFAISPVSAAELADYDIWSVEIIAANASRPMDDVKVSLNVPGNKGIDAVYNGGTYFLAKGTEVTPDNLNVTATNADAQTNPTPSIKVDAAARKITVNYNEAPVVNTGISVSPAELALEAGKTALLTATVEPADAPVKEITWTSSNEAVATVSADGTVTAVAAGTATVTATCADFSATCAVTVTEPVEDGIDAIETEQDAKALYDLQGRRVISPARGGLYISGNKIVKIR